MSSQALLEVAFRSGKWIEYTETLEGSHMRISRTVKSWIRALGSTLFLIGIFHIFPAQAQDTLTHPAQEGDGPQNHNPKHHHYKLIDLGTFGGAQSNFVPGSGNDINPFTSAVNNRGTGAGYADTSTPDPFAPNFCFENCNVVRAFQAGKSGHLTDLGVLPGGASSAPLWISENGLIAGLSENGKTDPLYAGLPEVHAVLWQHGKITDLGTLGGGYESEANAVNSAGQVVGAALNTVPDPNSMAVGTYWLWGVPYGYQTRAFIWEKGVMRDLGTLPGGTDAQAILINEKGQVVGYSYTSSSPTTTACAPAASVGFASFPLATGSFIWDEENGMVDLGGLGGTCTLANDLNNQGQVIGMSYLAGDQSAHAFLWEHGALRDLGGTLGGDFTGAFVMNAEGEAVGYADLSGNTVFHATLWKHVGDMTDLGTVGSDQCSYATGINASGQVVGGSIPDCSNIGPNNRAFLWEDGSIVDLNTLIPSGSGLFLQSTITINDRGEIAGNGADASGNGHAFLLIPCDSYHQDIEGCDYSLKE